MSGAMKETKKGRGSTRCGGNHDILEHGNPVNLYEYFPTTGAMEREMSMDKRIFHVTLEKKDIIAQIRG